MTTQSIELDPLTSKDLQLLAKMAPFISGTPKRVNPFSNFPKPISRAGSAHLIPSNSRIYWRVVELIELSKYGQSKGTMPA